MIRKIRWTKCKACHAFLGRKDAWVCQSVSLFKCLYLYNECQSAYFLFFISVYLHLAIGSKVPKCG